MNHSRCSNTQMLIHEFQGMSSLPFQYFVEGEIETANAQWATEDLLIVTIGQNHKEKPTNTQISLKMSLLDVLARKTLFANI